MGRVEVVLDEELERQLRIHAVTRFGGRKGALASAVNEAISEYVARDALPKLVEAARDPRASKKTRIQALEALRSSGLSGLQALVEIAADAHVDEFGREVAAVQAQEYQSRVRRRLENAGHPMPAVIRDEYGPENSRVVHERIYRRAKKVPDSRGARQP